jgi:hypothetical protein
MRRCRPRREGPRRLRWRRRRHLRCIRLRSPGSTGIAVRARATRVAGQVGAEAGQAAVAPAACGRAPATPAGDHAARILGRADRRARAVRHRAPADVGLAASRGAVGAGRAPAHVDLGEQGLAGGDRELGGHGGPARASSGEGVRPGAAGRHDANGVYAGRHGVARLSDGGERRCRADRPVGARWRGGGVVSRRQHAQRHRCERCPLPKTHVDSSRSKSGQARGRRSQATHMRLTTKRRLQ